MRREALTKREKRRGISEGIGGIDDRYLEEVEQFKNGSQKARLWRKAATLSAVAVLILSIFLIGMLRFFSPAAAVVYAYTYGTDERLTKAGVSLQTGRIAQGGEQTGHPLMFYLSGEAIRSVRFSCKNQELIFTDWTEKREEYGSAKNFTILYGEDREEYPYLTINWEPKETVQKLHENCTIAELPKELKEDLIVMEITFADGRQEVKAIGVSLLEDGTFFATFDDYEIGPSDSFVEREDALTLQEQSGIRLSEQEHEIGPDEVEPGEERGSGGEETTQKEPVAEMMEDARKVANEYYAGTVFEVVSIRERHISEEEIVFEVSVKKDGILQDPDRTIFLQKRGKEWEVVNEGY